MSNIKEQIRAEVERRYEENRVWARYDDYYRGMNDGLDHGNLEEISSIDKDQLARSAASEWCQCFKCDGIINDTRLQCDKPNVTCLKWRDAYRAAKIALGKVKLAQNTEVKIEEEDEQ